jgi:hypothetical protein
VTTPRPRRPLPPPPRAAIAFARQPGRLFGITTVGSFVPGLTKKAFEKYGFSATTLITDWPAIVGPDFARCTAPERLKWPRNVDRGEDDDARPMSNGDAPGLAQDLAQGLTQDLAQGLAATQGPGNGRGGRRQSRHGQLKGRLGATLVLRVEGAHALDVQYRARQIIERINGYFGYAAVAALRVIQAPVHARAQAPGLTPAPLSARGPVLTPVLTLGAAAPRPIPRLSSAPALAAATPELAGIADAGLRDALARLGAGIRTGR